MKDPPFVARSRAIVASVLRVPGARSGRLAVQSCNGRAAVDDPALRIRRVACLALRALLIGVAGAGHVSRATRDIGALGADGAAKPCTTCAAGERRRAA